jgi:hypothetical protein
MQTLSLSYNKLTGTPPFAHVAGSTSLPLALKTSFFALAGSLPTEFGKLINMKCLWLKSNKLSGTPPFAQVAWFGNMQHLFLRNNKLTGTPPFAHFTLFCTQFAS